MDSNSSFRSDSTFYNASDKAFDATPDTGSCDFAHMDPEQKVKLEEEWRTELARTEEEIQTLRQVLSSKVRHATELKRKLGITVWKEFRDDLGQGVKSIQESTALKDASHKLLEWNNAIQSAPISGLGSSIGMFAAPAYQKTTEVVKAAGEKTTSVFGSLGGSVARKLGEVKNSNAFKSFEEKVVSATGSLKDRMTGPRSNSTNSFEDALNNVERRSSTSASTPTIPEDKLVS